MTTQQNLMTITIIIVNQTTTNKNYSIKLHRIQWWLQNKLNGTNTHTQNDRVKYF